jgi:hypothetical protein
MSHPSISAEIHGLRSTAIPADAEHVPSHLLAEDEAVVRPRVRLAGANYRGVHRSAAARLLFEPGALVLEGGSQVPSSVIRHVDTSTVLVRHVGTCDDHCIAVEQLRPFADGLRVRIGADFTN